MGNSIPKRKRVLVVDDDPDMVTLVRDALEAAGYETLDAPDGLEGILKGTNLDLDLVILDVMMPLADGLGVLNALKAIRPQLPVILLTAKTSKADIDQGFLWGCDEYVTKPFAIQDLLHVVRRTIAGASAA